jgi:protein-disulfide isomerase
VPKTPQSLSGAPTIGKESAKVAIIEFADFQCPFCGQFSKTVWPELRSEYVDKGTVLAAFRHLPLSIHPYARDAAIRAVCAEKQDKFWEMHDSLFAHQSDLGNVGAMDELARQLPVDMPAFSECVRTVSAETINSDVKRAQALGISGTPTFLIGIRDADGLVHVTAVLSGAQPLERFKSAVDEALDSAAKHAVVRSATNPGV